MSLLYPHFLWLGIPLVLLWTSGTKKIEMRTDILVLMLIVLALSRPVKEDGFEQSKIAGRDIVIALDASYSMKADDLKPNRYEFAKKTINHLLTLNPTDNIMLIAFTTNPLLLSPPTTDHELISIALKNLNPEYILTKGTSLEKLFKKIASFSTGDKNLILMTDGGEERDSNKLLTILQKANISLTTLALGRQSGSTISNEDGSLLQDKKGNLVITRINPLLKTLTSYLQGEYLTASSTPEATAEALSHAIEAQNDKYSMTTKRQHHYQELYQIPLLLAMLLFLMLHTRAVKYLLLLFTLLGIQAEASMLDSYHLFYAYQTYEKQDYNATLTTLNKIEIPTLQSQLLRANNDYKTGAYKHAIHLYRGIHSSSAKIKQMLFYNIANAYVQLGTYSKAKIYYTKVLQLGEDKDALHNLALIVSLADKDNALLGVAHPKSQSSSASKSESQESDSKSSKKEEQSSSGSGSGGKNRSKSKEQKQTLVEDKNLERHPMGSKTYDLINKGYIRETKPW